MMYLHAVVANGMIDEDSLLARRLQMEEDEAYAKQLQ
jgi:hypothetical protein